MGHALGPDSLGAQVVDDAAAAGEVAGADRDEHRAGPRQPTPDPGRPGRIAVGEVTFVR